MKFKITLTAVLVLAYSAFALTDVTEYDAETFYKSALTYFKVNDFRNTLRSVHLAKDIFTNLGKQDGVIRCNQLITQVDSLLTDGQMASAYYDIAGEYFLQENPSVSSFMRAREFAQYAKDYYNRAGDGEGVLRSNDLINRAQAEINAIKNVKQEDAYRFYRSAQDSYFREDYLLARIYALNASLLYNEILDENGISKTASLITSIDLKINEVKYNALASYDRALYYYVQEDYESAYRYATISQQLYTKIGDSDGMTKAAVLVSRINTESTELSEKKLRLAQSYYGLAEESLIRGDYVNATDYAKAARNIYMEFYDKAVEEEKDLPDNQRVKMKLYSSHIQTIDNLINRINSEWGSEKKREQAELFYTKAQELYIEGQLDFALNYAQRAKSYFTDLNDYIGANKCDALINSINNRLADKRQADGYYNQALGFYSIAEFENALLYTGKARNLYVKILDTASTARADNLTLMINEGMKLRDNATDYYQRSRTYFNVGDYENARTYSQKAYDIYVEINYTLGILNSEQILNQSTGQIEAAYLQLRNTVIAGALIVIIGGYLLTSRIKTRKAYKSELKKEKDKLEKEKTMKEKEWAVKREAETKEKVEEELRRLIEQERGQVFSEQEQATVKDRAESKTKVEEELRRLVEQERGQTGSVAKQESKHEASVDAKKKDETKRDVNSD